MSRRSVLLMGDVPTVVWSALPATLGVICLAGWLHSYFFFGPARWWERVLLIVGASVPAAGRVQ
ncbi:MAG: hypothetical protein ABI434_07090 [Burkholderiaceae bacterium]